MPFFPFVLFVVAHLVRPVPGQDVKKVEIRTINVASGTQFFILPDGSRFLMMEKYSPDYKKTYYLVSDPGKDTWHEARNVQGGGVGGRGEFWRGILEFDHPTKPLRVSLSMEDTKAGRIAQPYFGHKKFDRTLTAYASPPTMRVND